MTVVGENVIVQADLIIKCGQIIRHAPSLCGLNRAVTMMAVEDFFDESLNQNADFATDHCTRV